MSALSASGTTATATVASTADMRTGDVIQLVDAVPTVFNNGSARITVVDATTFTYAWRRPTRVQPRPCRCLTRVARLALTPLPASIWARSVTKVTSHKTSYVTTAPFKARLGSLGKMREDLGDLSSQTASMFDTNDWSSATFGNAPALIRATSKAKAWPEPRSGWWTVTPSTRRTVVGLDGDDQRGHPSFGTTIDDGVTRTACVWSQARAQLCKRELLSTSRFRGPTSVRSWIICPFRKAGATARCCRWRTSC